MPSRACFVLWHSICQPPFNIAGTHKPVQCKRRSTVSYAKVSIHGSGYNIEAVPKSYMLGNVDVSGEQFLAQFQSDKEGAASTILERTHEFSSSVAGASDTSLVAFASRAADITAQLSKASSDFASSVTDSLSALKQQLLSPTEVSENISDVSGKVFEVTTEVVNKSSDLSIQLSNSLANQLSSVPDLEAEFAAKADYVASTVTASAQASSQLTAGILPAVLHEISVFQGLLMAGQYSEALATPGGVSVLGVAAGCVLRVGTALGRPSASSTPKDSTDTESIEDENEGDAPDAASKTSQVSDVESARVWISAWRREQQMARPKHSASVEVYSSFIPSDSTDDHEPFSNGITFSLNGSARSLNGAQNGAPHYSHDTLSQSATSSSPSSYDKPGKPFPTDITEGIAAQEEAPEPSPVATMDAAKEVSVVELRYHSGWEAPIIHACVAGCEWGTTVMERDSEGVLVWMAYVDEGAQLEDGCIAEFVITDGEGDWDKSPSGENYRLGSVGVYELRDGNLTEL